MKKSKSHSIDVTESDLGHKSAKKSTECALRNLRLLVLFPKYPRNLKKKKIIELLQVNSDNRLIYVCLKFFIKIYLSSLFQKQPRNQPGKVREN